MPSSKLRTWSIRIATVATAAAVLAAIVLTAPSSRADVPFRRVIEKLQSAETLQVRQIGITSQSAGYTSVSWIRQPGRARIDYVQKGVPGTAVMTGGQRWDIDEAANAAKSQPFSFGPRVPVTMFFLNADPELPEWKKFLPDPDRALSTRWDGDCRLSLPPSDG